MSRARKPGRWYALSLLILLGIWVLSSGGQTPGPPLPHPLDWLAHGLTYLALAYSLTRATGWPGFALVFAAWFGASDEVHQAFVPGREAGIHDWLADVTGAWLGLHLARPGRAGAKVPPVAGDSMAGDNAPHVPVLSEAAD